MFYFTYGSSMDWNQMRERCPSAKPEPMFRVEPREFLIEFPFSTDYLDSLTSGRAAQETPVKTPDRILDALAANPQLTLTDVAASIGKSLSAVERAGARLVKEGRLRHVGPRKGGYWEVLDEKSGVRRQNEED